MKPLTLISHDLCPYVQRVAIVLAEKRIPFERVYIDLANKPAWFLRVSPLGKTPVLLTEGDALFESSVICEYLDEVYEPRLHPEDPAERARHRGWMEYGSSVLSAIGSFYSAPDETALRERAMLLRQRFALLESVLGAGPYFAGARFSMPDAAFGPVFRYFDVFEVIGGFDWFKALPKVQAWRIALRDRESVAGAVGVDYSERLLGVEFHAILTHHFHPILTHPYSSPAGSRCG